MLSFGYAKWLAKHEGLAWFAGIFLSIALLGTHFFPPHDRTDVWVSEPIEGSLQWDTGYGWNSDQQEILSGGDKPAWAVDGISYRRVKEFSRLAHPTRIRVRSSLPGLKAGISSGSGFQPLELRPAPDVAGSVYDANLPEAGGRGAPWLRPNYLAGLCIVASLFTCLALMARSWVRDFRRGGRQELHFLWLSIMILAGVILFTWCLFPGLLNAANPVGSILGIEEYHFSPTDSLPLQMLWAAVYEVFPSQSALNFLQYLAFAAGLLAAAKRLVSIGWHVVAVGALLLALLFSPVALVYSVFLERSVASGYVICAFTILAFIAIARGRSLSAKEAVGLGIVGGACVVLRPDNIPIALLLVLAASFRSGLRRLLQAMVPLFALGLLNLGLLDSRIAGGPGWEPKYVTISTIATFSDLLRSGCRSPLSKDEASIADQVLKVDDLGKGAALSQIPIFQFVRWSATPEANRKYLEVFRSLAWRNPECYLSSRLALFMRLLRAGGWWDYTELPARHAALRDLGLFPTNEERATHEGARGLKPLRDLAGSPLGGLHPQLALVFLAVLLWPLAPASACLGIGLLTRVAAVFFLAPADSFFYLYDVYLVGIFLPFAIVFEARKRWPKLRPWIRALST